ncbi:MAG: hypothetical protein WC759_02565 [Candidatus Micrarchaeia archaeon]|jgi:hypothetical protein
MIIYCYDLKIKNPNAYNTLKRRFYYHLKKSSISKAPWKTKSVLAVPDKLEKLADTFFRQWRGFIEVYKIRADEIEQLL